MFYHCCWQEINDEVADRTRAFDEHWLKEKLLEAFLLFHTKKITLLVGYFLLQIFNFIYKAIIELYHIGMELTFNKLTLHFTRRGKIEHSLLPSCPFPCLSFRLASIFVGVHVFFMFTPYPKCSALLMFCVYVLSFSMMRFLFQSNLSSRQKKKVSLQKLNPSATIY